MQEVEARRNMTFLKFKCPHCGVIHKYDTEEKAMLFNCSACDQFFSVRQTSEVTYTGENHAEFVRY